VKDFAKVSYAPVGQCIYCGETSGLSKEHIIPYALGSNTSLPKASCERCRKITGDFEQQVLRGPMWPVRVFRKLQSRTKHGDAAKTESLIIVKDGKDQVIKLPLDEYPILLPFLLFPLPAITSSTEYENGIQLIGQVTIAFGANPETVLKKFGATEIKITPRKLYPVSFARMLAKIAYSYAFAEGALNIIDGKSVVLPSILGERDEIGLWVGMIDTPLIARAGLLHRIELIQGQGFLMAEIQLFSDSQTPSYLVILGKLK
jgi:hypothetical protein